MKSESTFQGAGKCWHLCSKTKKKEITVDFECWHCSCLYSRRTKWTCWVCPYRFGNVIDELSSSKTLKGLRTSSCTDMSSGNVKWERCNSKTWGIKKKRLCKSAFWKQAASAAASRMFHILALSLPIEFGCGKEAKFASYPLPMFNAGQRLLFLCHLLTNRPSSFCLFYSLHKPAQSLFYLTLNHVTTHPPFAYRNRNWFIKTNAL